VAYPVPCAGNEFGLGPTRRRCSGLGQISFANPARSRSRARSDSFTNAVANHFLQTHENQMLSDRCQDRFDLRATNAEGISFALRLGFGRGAKGRSVVGFLPGTDRPKPTPSANEEKERILSPLPPARPNTAPP